MKLTIDYSNYNYPAHEPEVYHKAKWFRRFGPVQSFSLGRLQSSVFNGWGPKCTLYKHRWIKGDNFQICVVCGDILKGGIVLPHEVEDVTVILDYFHKYMELRRQFHYKKSLAELSALIPVSLGICQVLEDMVVYNRLMPPLNKATATVKLDNKVRGRISQNMAIINKYRQRIQEHYTTIARKQKILAVLPGTMSFATGPSKLAKELDNTIKALYLEIDELEDKIQKVQLRVDNLRNGKSTK